TLLPARRFPVAPFAAASVVAIGLAVFGASRMREAAMCKGAPALIGEVWNDSVRSEIGQHFKATGVPFADEAAASFARRVDAYSERWSALYTGACVATRIRREQSDDALDARVACLERSRIELRVLVAEARTATRETISQIPQAAMALRDLGECEDSASLLGQV